MEEKTYTVIELAETLGVARTTVNDWLSRYTQYIDFKMVGRRRVYTESALAVLKEISELRNKGLAGADIETELAKTHPVRPEPADAVPPPQQDSPRENAAGKVPVPVPADEFALIAKKQSDELGKIIAESFRDMADRMQSLERKANRAERKLYLGYGVVFLLLLALLALGAFLFLRQDRATEQTRSAELRQNEAIQAVDDKAVRLTGSADELRRGIDELKSGLSVQQNEFNRALKEMKSANEKEIAALKERFAAEKKAQLERMEQLSREKDREISGLKEKESRSAQQLKALEQKLKAEQEKRKQELQKQQNQTIQKKDQ